MENKDYDPLAEDFLQIENDPFCEPSKHWAEPVPGQWLIWKAWMMLPSLLKMICCKETVV